MYAFKVLIFLLFAMPFFGQSVAQELPVLELGDYVSSPDISEAMLRAENYSGEITRSAIMARLKDFHPIADEANLRVASERGHSIFLLEVQNTSNAFGEWVFTSRRHSVNRFAIYDITRADPITLVDSAVPADNAQNIRRYIGYGAVLKLEPGERKTLAVYADIEVLRAVPFEFYAVDAYLDEYYWQSTRFAFFLPTIFILIFINLLFFAFLGRPFFLYLAASEGCFLLVALHSAAYLDAYGLAAFPILAIQISELAKCGFIIFMTLFAMSFLNTVSEHPRFHKILQALLLIGLALVLFWLCAGLVSKETRVAVRVWTWVYSGGGSLIFPIIGGLAVARFGVQYVPLMIGWSAVAMVGFYIAAYTVFPSYLPLPRIVTILAIIGWQEAIFVTLSAVWKAWQDNQEKRRSAEAHARSLQDRLEAISRANQLQEENALATSTIQDQNAMLQASGHDTRQVLLAINAAADVLERGPGERDSDLIGTLKASSAYLDDILSTTLTAKRTYSTSRKGLALSAFPVEDLLRSLTRIYQPAFRRKGLSFQTQSVPDVQLVSDRALLIRALSNFIANALQATSQGGVMIEASKDKGNLCLTVTDTGCGIDGDLLDYLTAETADEISTPDSVERPVSGFKIAASILSQLHGSLDVATEVGVGTKIVITLPCALNQTRQADISDLETASGRRLVDLDRLAHGDDTIPDNVIGVSFDDSSIMRDRAASLVDVLFYKPLVRELIEHPAVKRTKSDQ
jgi:signal transduction histidine kinase